jgi:hypothetical protein
MIITQSKVETSSIILKNRKLSIKIGSWESLIKGLANTYPLILSLEKREQPNIENYGS